MNFVNNFEMILLTTAFEKLKGQTFNTSLLDTFKSKLNEQICYFDEQWITILNQQRLLGSLATVGNNQLLLAT